MYFHALQEAKQLLFQPEVIKSTNQVLFVFKELLGHDFHRLHD